MKKLVKNLMVLVFLITMCACDGFQNSRRTHFSYSAIIEQKNSYFDQTSVYRSFVGLAVKEDSEYKYFDDESSYDSEIVEWGTYYWIANALFENGVKDPEELDNILASIPNLPDFSNVTNEKYAQIIKSEYYNNQDLVYYEPTRRYGIHTYPTDKKGADLVRYDRSLTVERFGGTDKGRFFGEFPKNVLMIGEKHTNIRKIDFSY